LIEKVGSGAAAIHKALFTRFVRDIPSAKRLQILVDEQHWFDKRNNEVNEQEHTSNTKSVRLSTVSGRLLTAENSKDEIRVKRQKKEKQDKQKQELLKIQQQRIQKEQFLTETLKALSYTQHGKQKPLLDDLRNFARKNFITLYSKTRNSIADEIIDWLNEAIQSGKHLVANTVEELSVESGNFKEPVFQQQAPTQSQPLFQQPQPTMPYLYQPVPRFGLAAPLVTSAMYSNLPSSWLVPPSPYQQ